jgi:uncharacterized membrane protein YccC
MTDELDETEVEGLDRSELIAQLRRLEGQRSAWEMRVRRCQERESLYKGFVEDIAKLLTVSIQLQTEGTKRVGEQAAKLMETIQQVMEQVEAI